MNPQDQWLLQKEKTLAWVRLGFSVAAILVIQLNPERIARFPVLSHVSLISFSTYSLLVLYLIGREGVSVMKVALVTTTLDLLWISLIVLSTGGSRTPFFVYYLFPVITSSSRYGIRGGLAVSLVGFSLYGLIRLSPLSPEPIAIDTFVVRSIYLVVLAYIFGFLSEFEKRQNDKLVALYKTAAEAATLEERRRIARELHDRLLQVLASLALRLEACRKNASSPPEEMARELHSMEVITRSSMEDIRRFLSGKEVFSLVPGTLIEKLKEEMEFLRDGLGLNVILESEPEDLNLSSKVEQELYYILREGLFNIARHSHASRVTVLLKETEKTIHGSLEDDGIGFNLPETRSGSGLGLVTMEDRINKLGGKLTIQTSPGKGTTVTFAVPRTTAGAHASGSADLTERTQIN